MTNQLPPPPPGQYYNPYLPTRAPAPAWSWERLSPRMRVLVGAAAAVLAGVAFVVALDAAGRESVKGGVVVTGCLRSAAGPVATLWVTNHGDATASYAITVAFISSDGSTQYDTAVATVNDLAPGQQASTTAQGFGHITSEFGCQVVDATRF